MAQVKVTAELLRKFAETLRTEKERFENIKSQMDEQLFSFMWDDPVAVKFKTDYEKGLQSLKTKLLPAMDKYQLHLDTEANVIDAYTENGSLSPSAFKAAAIAAGVVGVGGATVGNLVNSTIAIPSNISESEWISQGKDTKGCKRACDKMLNNRGFLSSHADGQITIMNNTEGRASTANENFDKGIEEINKTLEAGKPIVVAVDYKGGHPGNADKMTDHFIVITGMTKSQNRTQYRFFDPRTQYKKYGTNPQNILTLEKGKKLLSGTYKDNKTTLNYTVVGVRPTYDKRLWEKPSASKMPKRLWEKPKRFKKT